MSLHEENMEVNKHAVVILTAALAIQLILFVLKIFRIVDWNWLWILAPLWLPYAGILLLIVLLILFDIICRAIVNIKKG